MGLGQNFLVFFCLGWVRSGQPPLGLKNFQKNPKKFNFFLSGQKNIVPVSRFFFTVGQKCAQVGSGPISTSISFQYFLHSY